MRCVQDTDAASLLQSGLSYQVEKAQSQLIALCHEFRRSGENVVPSIDKEICLSDLEL